MSEKFWKILVNELKVVRIVCRHNGQEGTAKPSCGAIVEVPIGKLGQVTKCPLCGNQIHPPFAPGEDPFLWLRKSLEQMDNFPGAEFSFVLPDDGEN